MRIDLLRSLRLFRMVAMGAKVKAKVVVSMLAAVVVAGCVHTNEVAMAPNVVRLDTQASGLLFSGQAGPQTQKRAAELTLQNGYTHFRFEQLQTGQSRELVGVNTFENGNVTGGYRTASYSGTSSAIPIYRNTQNVGVTVVMFHANEPGAQGAFDATDVLRKFNSRS